LTNAVKNEVEDIVASMGSTDNAYDSYRNLEEQTIPTAAPSSLSPKMGRLRIVRKGRIKTIAGSGYDEVAWKYNATYGLTATETR
jgi:hypothetical protein